MSRILLLGCGGHLYREYVLASLFEAGYEMVALDAADAAWADPYLVSRVRLDVAQTDVVEVAAGLHRRSPFDGVLTYDETKVELAAEVALALGLPGLSREAARRCRDKHAMRAAFAAAGVPSAQSELVHDLDGALDAGERIGYPVVLKPRSLAGSIGVVRVDDPEELSNHFSVTASARHPLFPAQHGLLVEEYLDGPELSVESVVVEGRVHVCGMTKKQVGFAPFFEEVGHVTRRPCAWPGSADVVRTAVEAHAALGIAFGATHAEVRITKSGPRMIEVAARLGGDMIPYLVRLATGVDMATATAAALTGGQPDLMPSSDRVGAVRLLYPPHDGVTRTLKAPALADPPWHAVAWEARPGQHVSLPPRGFMARLGYVVVVGDDERECSDRLDRSLRSLDIVIDPVDGAWPVTSEARMRSRP